MVNFTSICTSFTYQERVKCAKIYRDRVLREMPGILINTRKIEVIPRYAGKNKSVLHLPRHSSFMIMHTFADWGRVRHNRVENLEITTVYTTKAHGCKWDKGKGVGRIP